MAKEYKAKGIHTSPSTAGEKNLKGKKLPKGDGVNDKIYPIMEQGKSDGYTGKWTDEKFAESVDKFFQYCAENDIKPTQPLLRLWLNVSRSQLYDWRNKPRTYGGKSDILERAFDYMEAFLQFNIDKYPTGSIFLLKSSHGHAETQNINFVGGDSDDVKENIKRLGLDES